ncbi:MAG: (Fe-S)-binding protein [Gammaproteobacteria bacterium]|nr:(Fe-S)-binding protein [Gammaproteobacteria bacterium]
MKTSSSRPSPSDFADTDLCVLCGMCTPHCPTYSLYKIEAESPRGRIMMIQALANNQLVADDKTVMHLNHCLGCRACESICPSKVPFMALMDKARQLTAPQHKQPAVIDRLLNTIKENGNLRQSHGLLNIIGHTGIHRLSKLIPNKAGSTLSKSVDLLAHNKMRKFEDYYPAINEAIGSVLLFTGCMGSMFNSDTLQSCIQLLTHFGFNVFIPKDQYCCGALHQHNGQIDTATELARKNADVFQQYDVVALIYIDSGCGAQLVQQQTALPAFHINQFVLQKIQPGPDRFNSRKQTILLHESCSLRNSLKLGGINQTLVELIPGLNIQKMPNSDTCCGAGGSNFLEYPELADQLLDQKLNTINPVHTSLLISDNIGCSLHLKSALRLRKIKLEVIHPVTLLADQLK